MNLGEKDLTDKDIRDVGNEVVSKCIVSPQLRKTDVARLDQQTVIQLATECLNLIRENDKTSGLAFGSVSGMSELDGNEGNN